jgi:hypothetical protein
MTAASAIFAAPEQQESSRTAADRSLRLVSGQKTIGLSRGVRGKETLGRLRDPAITEGT